MKASRRLALAQTAWRFLISLRIRFIIMKSHFFQKAESLDAAGATASLLCAIHCALMPFVVTLLPLVGLSFLASETTEWLLLALSATLGISSLCLGFRAHRSRRALAVLAVGLALAATGRIAEHGGSTPFLPHLPGVALLVVGGVLVALSHGLNFYLCRACLACHVHDDCKHAGGEA